jgi:hypothetical protein
VTTLTLGLPEESRTKRRISGRKIDFKEALLASILDGIRILQWQNLKKRRKPPESVLKELLGLTKKNKDDLASFTSIDDYQAWYEAKRKTNNE